MAELSSDVQALLKKKAFAHFATVMKDGSPQVSPVWVDVDGDIVVINSAEGRLKDKNVKRDARVAVSVTDPDNDYNAVMIRGRVVEITTDGADAHIDAMAKKYMGVDSYPYRTDKEQRVIYRIAADRVSTMG